MKIFAVSNRIMNKESKNQNRRDMVFFVSFRPSLIDCWVIVAFERVKKHFTKLEIYKSHNLLVYKLIHLYSNFGRNIQRRKRELFFEVRNSFFTQYPSGDKGYYIQERFQTAGPTTTEPLTIGE